MSLHTIKLGFLACCAAVCLLLLIPTCICWGRSYFLTDDLHYHSAGRFTRFRSSGGGFWYETRPWNGNEPPGLQWQKFKERPQYPLGADESSPLLERCGFLYSTKGYDLLLVAPYWPLATGLLLGLFASCILMSSRRSASTTTDAA